ncbi:MAG: arsenate reductase ArsC, partial [Planctomycetota bacterium]|nr:arsenate reductase ArsC [Planctomycetota bacterium]
MTTHQSASILFLCTHNAGRSQMAAGWARHLGGAAIEIFSGGSSPADAVNPVAVEAMKEVGIDISGAQPMRWTKAMVDRVDAVVSMGCGDRCPILPGKRYLDWTLTDPAGEGIELVRRVRDEIRAHVGDLLAELG